MCATEGRHPKMVEVLVRAGADVHACHMEVSLDSGAAAQAVIFPTSFTAQ